jgi:hypothetical protein
MAPQSPRKRVLSAIDLTAERLGARHASSKTANLLTAPLRFPLCMNFANAIPPKMTKLFVGVGRFSGNFANFDAYVSPLPAVIPAGMVEK